MKEADVVGIDEAQFYPDLVEVCDSLADLGVVRSLLA
jgi:thymidine kinase